MYYKTKLVVPPWILLYGVLQCHMGVCINQGELTAKGIYEAAQRQVLYEVFFQHSPRVVYASCLTASQRQAV